MIQPEEILIRVFVFILGAIVGSFLNVCIVRLPQSQSIVRPRSHCVHCHVLIPWYDNIPLVSCWILKGRCRFCHKKISLRYFVVELTTALLFLGFYLYFGRTLLLVPYWVLVSGLIVATFIDLEHRIIPDEISVGGVVVGLVFSFVFPQLHGTVSRELAVGRAVIGAIAGGGLLLAMGAPGDRMLLGLRRLGVKLRKHPAWRRRLARYRHMRDSMGGGDVKLLAMIGSFLGWPTTLLAFFIAPFFGAIVGIIIKLRTKESVIAYGPFLSLGALVSLFWGREILGWIFYQYVWRLGGA